MPTNSFSLRNILVATDFSEDSAAALGRAVKLTEKTKANILVVHVLTNVAAVVPATSYEFHWQIPPGALRRAERQLRAQAEQRLAKWLAPYKRLPGKLRTDVRAGVPFIEIIRAAQKNKSDLVLAGTRGMTALKRLLVGSTAERLVRKCPCPVWIVHPEHEWPLPSILVPVDFSEVSGRCLEIGAFLARLSKCALSVLHVCNFPVSEADPLWKEVARHSFHERRRLIRQEAAHRLNDLLNEHVPPGVELHPRIAVGLPWKMINLAASQEDAGLIVMGSVGRAGIPGFFIGNTAEKVLRTSGRSILTVKPAGFVSPVEGKTR